VAPETHKKKQQKTEPASCEIKSKLGPGLPNLAAVLSFDRGKADGASKPAEKLAEKKKDDGKRTLNLATANTIISAGKTSRN